MQKLTPDSPFSSLPFLRPGRFIRLVTGTTTLTDSDVGTIGLFEKLSSVIGTKRAFLKCHGNHRISFIKVLALGDEESSPTMCASNVSAIDFEVEESSCGIYIYIKRKEYAHNPCLLQSPILRSPISVLSRLSKHVATASKEVA